MTFVQISAQQGPKKAPTRSENGPKVIIKNSPKQRLFNPPVMKDKAMFFIYCKRVYHVPIFFSMAADSQSFYKFFKLNFIPQ